MRRRAVEGLFRLPLVRRVVAAGVRRDPELALELLAAETTRSARFRAVSAWPPAIGGMEDLAFLFASNKLNMGIALLTFEEAAHLFATARSLGPNAAAVEIGRFKGGSTLLLAAALPEDGRLWSYDLHAKLTTEVSGPELDAELAQALERYGLDDRVTLVVGDSRTAEPPPTLCDLVFLDGDHLYDGVRADYERWRTLLRPGGHILFHDAAGGTCHEGVARVVAEVDEDDREWFDRKPGAGSIVHFTRTSVTAPWDARERLAQSTG